MNKRRWLKRLMLVAVVLVVAVVISLNRSILLADSAGSLPSLPQATMMSYQVRYDTTEGETYLLEDAEQIRSLSDLLLQLKAKPYRARGEQVLVMREQGYHILIFYSPQADSVEVALFCDHNGQAYLNAVNDNTTYLIGMPDFQTITAHLQEMANPAAGTDKF